VREILTYKSSETGEKVIDIIDLRLEINKGPLILRAKSPLIEAWVTKMHTEAFDTVGWGLSLRGLPRDFYKTNPTYRLNLPNRPLKGPEDGVINLTWLLAAGLDKGITISWTGLFTDVARKEIRDSLQDGLTTFYKDFLRPWEVEVKITSEMREQIR
jgi:hypothetical protein